MLHACCTQGRAKARRRHLAAAVRCREEDSRLLLGRQRRVERQHQQRSRRRVRGANLVVELTEGVGSGGDLLLARAEDEDVLRALTVRRARDWPLGVQPQHQVEGRLDHGVSAARLGGVEDADGEAAPGDAEHGRVKEVVGHLGHIERGGCDHDPL